MGETVKDRLLIVMGTGCCWGRYVGRTNHINLAFTVLSTIYPLIYPRSFSAALSIKFMP